MAHIVYYVASSADGFIARSDGSLDWLEPYSGTEEDHGYTDFYASIDALIVGSRTYEQMLGFGEWPHQDRPVTVMTSRSLPVDAENISLSGEDPLAVVARLTSSGCERMWLVGGGALAGAFDAAGLIDEYVVSYVPVVLGLGVRLLGGRANAHTLELLGVLTFDDGIVQHRYRRVVDD